MLRLGLLVATLATLSLACEPNPKKLPPTTLELTSCRPKQFPRPAQCGVLEVDAIRGTPSAAAPAGASTPARLPLRVVRLPAQGPNRHADPLFLLAGGPGQASSEAFAAMLVALAGVGQTRDLVMIDQRGTGSSYPLDCDTPKDLAWSFLEGTLPDVASRCAAQLKHDPRAFTTAASADDIDDVRKVLGYSKINLLGISYGTRLALRYARRHPDAVRSLVLDGVAPPEMRIPLSFAADGQAALDNVFARCAADPACAERFPRLADQLQALLKRLHDEPVQVDMPHPRNGSPLSFRLSGQVFAQTLRGLLYSPELIALLPLMIDRAHAGDYRSFVAQSAALSESADDSMSLGLSLSILCSEELPRIEVTEVADASGGSFVGSVIVDDMLAGCARWPVVASPLPGKAPTKKIASPILALSGALDPVTPPHWVEKAAVQWETSQHVVVPEASHSVTIRGCVPRLIGEFLDQPREPLESGCVADQQLQAFFIDEAGPSMQTAPEKAEKPAKATEVQRD